MAEHLKYAEVYKNIHLPESTGYREEIARILSSNRLKIVVLDDDPTGIQTVHGCLLLTKWDEETLRMAFEDDFPLFYILTNSRSLNVEDASIVNRNVVEQLIKVNTAFQFQLILISRSDSTLRGHFPLETDTIISVLSAYNTMPSYPVFFIPALFEAGRYTVNNIHYMKSGDELVPVGETEFALDNVFGYHSSDLVDYIVEKSNNRISRNAIGSVSIADLREMEIEKIRMIVTDSREKEFIIINAFSYSDLQKFSLALLTLASEERKPLLLRTSSSMPKAISGIKDIPLLTKKDLVEMKRHGIFIIGSHVQKTTGQLNQLLGRKEIKGIEVDVRGLLETPDDMLATTIDSIYHSWEHGFMPVVYTSRQEVRMKDKHERLDLGKKVSGFLVEIVKNLPVRPSYILAKGGITAHDILTRGLNLWFARVAGQIMAGVPVILTGNDHKYPSMPYIIFPGNVGDENALVTLFDRMK
ncbi:MAG: hypothetical protein JW973_09215 [Bacteroidales bacterium]|nr:hypothetical protein [Bacteroidales bacterium]